jgi:hypothetical protein
MNPITEALSIRDIRYLIMLNLEKVEDVMSLAMVCKGFQNIYDDVNFTIDHTEKFKHKQTFQQLIDILEIKSYINFSSPKVIKELESFKFFQIFKTQKFTNWIYPFAFRQLIFILNNSPDQITEEFRSLKNIFNENIFNEDLSLKLDAILNIPLHLGLFEMFISNGIKIDAKDGDGDNILMLMCLQLDQLNRTDEHYESDKIFYESIIDLLLENNIEINSQSIDGKYPLMMLCSSVNYAYVEKLLLRGANPNLLTTSNYNCLHFVVEGYITYLEKERLDLAELLLRFGADSNVIIPVRNLSMLTYSINNSTTYMSQLLLKYGATVRINDLRFPYDCPDLLKVLVEKISEDFSNLESDLSYPNVLAEIAFSNIMRKNFRNAKILIENGANVNYCSDECSLLLLTAISESEELSKFLIEKGADVNFENETEKISPIYKFSLDNNANMVQLLIEHNADINYKGKYNFTSLMFFSSLGNLDMVKLLIKKGADVNAKSIGNLTSLILASHKGHLNIVKYLVENNASIDFQNDAGNTALIFAADNYKYSVYQYLISQGADISIQNSKNATALSLIHRAFFRRIISFLNPLSYLI